MLRFIFILLLALTFDEPEEAIATHKNYKDVIEYYKSLGTKIFDKKYWEEIEVIDKKTNKSKSFMTLKPLEKSTFVFVLGQSINQESAKVQRAWENELKKKFSNNSNNLATKDDVIKYSEQLYGIRKEFASKYEEFVGNMLSEFKDQVTDDERKVILKKMVEFHDQHKLLKRSKE